MVGAIGSERASKFTGKVHKLIVEVKEMKKADKAEEDKACMEAAHRQSFAKLIG